MDWNGSRKLTRIQVDKATEFKELLKKPPHKTSETEDGGLLFEFKDRKAYVQVEFFQCGDIGAFSTWDGRFLENCATGAPRKMARWVELQLAYLSNPIVLH